MDENAPTLLIRRWQQGDPAALEALVPLVHADLRRLARRELGRGNAGNTLQPTALVNDVFVHLLGRNALVEIQSHGHFLNLAARIMRQLVLMRARARGADKRGGGWLRADFQDALELPLPDSGRDADVEAALQRMEALRPRMAQVVELRCYVGLTVPEVAQALGVDVRTVYREWAAARAWLAAELGEP